MCVRLGHVINLFHELVQTAVPSGPVTDAIVRVLTKLYTSLTTLTKYVRNLNYVKVYLYSLH